MYTESRPGFDAKNRFNLPFCMALDWKSFGDAIRTFYGINGKSDGATKHGHESDKAEPRNDATLEAVSLRKSTPVQEQLKTTLNGSPNAPLHKVRRLLEESSISEPEFIEILKAAQIPEAKGSLSDIPDRVLDLALENWDTVGALAEELRQQKPRES